MGTRRYGIYLRLFNLISDDWGQPTSEISSWTQEEKFHICKHPCIILFTMNILVMIFLTIFRSFWTLSPDFRIFSKSVPKARRSFPKIPEKARRLPKIISNIYEKEPMMFRSYLSIFLGLWNHRNSDFFTSEIKMLFSRVKIFFLLN